jgi:DNA helicase HerA-like ATPase
VAENFPVNPDLDTEPTITDLGIGEALVSCLDAKGSPTPVQRTLIRPPESQIGPIDEAARRQRIERSPLRSRYDEMIDRESAFELLKARAEQQAAEEAQSQAREAAEKAEREARRSSGSGSRRQSAGEAMIKSAARAIGSQLGRQIIRGVLGSIFGSRR